MVLIHFSENDIKLLMNEYKTTTAKSTIVRWCQIHELCPSKITNSTVEIPLSINIEDLDDIEVLGTDTDIFN